MKKINHEITTVAFIPTKATVVFPMMLSTNIKKFLKTCDVEYVKIYQNRVYVKQVDKLKILCYSHSN